jgi:hypothetical protein
MLRKKPIKKTKEIPFSIEIGSIEKWKKKY